MNVMTICCQLVDGEGEDWPPTDPHKLRLRKWSC